MITVGIDEVGRGCWAGPLVAGAVILPPEFELPADAGWRLADSKTINRQARQTAALEIHKIAQAAGLGWVTAQEVDVLGLTEAVRQAMRRALDAVDLEYDEVVIDGNYNFLQNVARTSCLVKADALVPAVSAASIIAKVARDSWMEQAGMTYPGYGFESHVGYGTRQHIAALEQLGVCDIHRRSYRPVKRYLVT